MKEKYTNPKVEVVTFASTNSTNLISKTEANATGSADTGILKSIDVSVLKN